MQYKRYTLSVGLNDKDTLKPRFNYDSASLELAGRLAQLGIGATITRGTGVYKHDNGAVIIEDTVVISIIDFEDSFKDVMQAFIDKVKLDYNQESIAVMVDKIESRLA